MAWFTVLMQVGLSSTLVDVAGFSGTAVGVLYKSGLNQMAPTGFPLLSLWQDPKRVPIDRFQLAPRDNLCRSRKEPICSNPSQRVAQYLPKTTWASSLASRCLSDRVQWQRPRT